MAATQDQINNTPKFTYEIDKLFQNAREFHKNNYLSVLLWGPTEAGKTYCALTFPGPIFYIDLDAGLGPNMKYVPDDKVVNRVDCLDMMDDQGNIEADDYKVFKVNPKQTLRKFDHILTVLGQIHGGTVVVDTVTSIDEWLQDMLDIEKPVAPGEKGRPIFDWKYVNNKYNWLMEKLKHVDANLVLISRSKSVYVNYKPTEAQQYDTRAGTEYHVSISVEFEKRVTQDTDGKVNVKRIAKFSKFRGQSLAKRYEVEDITYDKIKEILALPENAAIVAKA